MTGRSRIFPVLRYRNPKAAIDFLVDAFGFTPKSVETSPEGVVQLAQLVLGDGLVMVGGFDPELAAKGRTASGGASSLYVSVPYVDGHHDKAVAAGALLVRPPQDMPYGAREYSCRDLEGYEWHFGTYDPLASEEA